MLQWLHNQRANVLNQNDYHESGLQSETDVWKIAPTSLNIDYKKVLGKGAFSVVYSGINIVLRTVHNVQSGPIVTPQL